MKIIRENGHNAQIKILKMILNYQRGMIIKIYSLSVDPASLSQSIDLTYIYYHVLRISAFQSNLRLQM